MGHTAQAERATGSDGRRWLLTAMVAGVVFVGAVAAMLTHSSTSDEVATGDDEVVIPEREHLREPDGRQQAEGPRIACEAEGEPVGCLAWRRRLVSASSAPDPPPWRVEVASDRVLAGDAETIVARSLISGQVAWRKDLDVGEAPAGGAWVFGDEVMAVQAGQGVRALSLVDGSETWSVDDARVAFPGRADQPGTIYTVQLENGLSLLAAHEADGTVRWRHELAEVDPATPLGPRRHRSGAVPVEVTEVGSVAFVVPHGPGRELHTIALDRDDGTERWRRADSRPLHASGGVAVVLDVAREVHEDDDRTSVSESPAAVVGLDATEGTERWRREAAGELREFRIVEDVLVTVEDDGLTGIDLATGEELWHSDVGEHERLITAAARWGRPSVSQHPNLTSFVSRDRRVLARDPATGEILWQTQLDQFVGHVSTVDDTILAMQSGSRSNGRDRVNETTFIQLDPATGHVRGTITTESDGQPQLVAPDVLVDTQAGWVARVDLSDT